MLPGKKYAPEDFWYALRRRFWYLLVPFAIISAATATVGRLLPDSYRSETLLLVVPQRVPESYVRSTVTAKIEDRLQSISQQIMSRTRLEQIIQEFDLYMDDRRTKIMEDIVQDMRGDIDIEVIKGDAFRVSYVGDEPRTVMRVTERLAGLFIEESVRDRGMLAETTNQFFDTQLEDAKRRLTDSEKKLEEYKRKFSGQLPSQAESNLQAIQGTQMQIRDVVQSLFRDRDERLMLQGMLAELQAEEGSADSLVLPPAKPESQPMTTARQLELERKKLTELERSFKPDHPDVQASRRAIRDLEKKAATEALEAPGSKAAVQASPTAVARERKVKELQQRLVQLDRRIEHGEQQEKQLRDVVASYRQRVEAVPSRESEMIALTRDYATLEEQYASLLLKREDSKMSANLERRQIGEQFRLLDAARLPERPYSPDRVMINLFGMAGGLVVGIALIGLLEYRDSTLKTDEEVAGVLALPVLAVIPLMQSDRDRKATFRRRLMIGTGLGATVVGCLAIVVYTFVVR